MADVFCLEQREGVLVMVVVVVEQRGKQRASGTEGSEVCDEVLVTAATQGCLGLAQGLERTNPDDCNSTAESSDFVSSS